MKVLLLSNLFPTSRDPVRGLFTLAPLEQRATAVERQHQIGTALLKEQAQHGSHVGVL